MTQPEYRARMARAREALVNAWLAFDLDLVAELQAEIKALLRVSPFRSGYYRGKT